MAEAALYNKGEIITASKLRAISQLVDLKLIKEILQQFYSLTQITTALIDLEGKVLIKAGWTDICEDFHRKHPKTLAF